VGVLGFGDPTLSTQPLRRTAVTTETIAGDVHINPLELLAEAAVRRAL
jgi:hypothetical protein